MRSVRELLQDGSDVYVCKFALYVLCVFSCALLKPESFKSNKRKITEHTQIFNDATAVMLVLKCLVMQKMHGLWHKSGGEEGSEKKKPV